VRLQAFGYRHNLFQHGAHTCIEARFVTWLTEMLPEEPENSRLLVYSPIDDVCLVDL